jgi:hypothetical protein
VDSYEKHRARNLALCLYARRFAAIWNVLSIFYGVEESVFGENAGELPMTPRRALIWSAVLSIQLTARRDQSDLSLFSQHFNRMSLSLTFFSALSLERNTATQVVAMLASHSQ